MFTHFHCTVCEEAGRIREIIVLEEQPEVYAVEIRQPYRYFAIYAPGRATRFAEQVEGPRKKCNRYCPQCHGTGHLPERLPWEYRRPE